MNGPILAPTRDGALSKTELLELLISECEQCGGVRAWARKHGVVPSLVSMTITGQRAASDTIANALGFFHIDLYIPRRPPPSRRAVAPEAAA